MHVIGNELKSIIRKSQDELNACENGGLYIEAKDFNNNQISVDAIDLYDLNSAHRIANNISKKKNFIRKLKRKNASKIITVGSGVLATLVLSFNSIATYSLQVKIAMISVVGVFYIFMTVIALLVLKEED